jgi:hypothetical protein
MESLTAGLGFIMHIQEVISLIKELMQLVV